MLTTVTLPVYNRSQDASNQTILGVMGMDVTTQRLMDVTPYRKLTPNGYSFAINRNGYIIFHPDLKAQYGWLQDPPNVDFLDLEYETDKKDELRTRMIDGEEGREYIQTFLVQADEKHIVEVNRTYFFTSIDNSDFSLGIVIPDYAQVYPEVTGKYSEEKGFDLLAKDSNTMLIPLRPYFRGYDKVNTSKATGTVQDLINARYTGQFDEDLLQLLFWDADMTQNIRNYFQLAMDQLNETCSGEGVLAAFIGTSSGLTRVHHECATKYMMNERDTWKAAYYKRALETDDYVFFAPPTGGIEGNDTIVPPITMVRAISISIKANKKTHKPAVFGIKMKHQKLLNLMADIDLGRGTCNDSDSVVCYLLDDGGFVIATNQIDKYAQVGHFFGTVDNTLMQELVNNSHEPKAQFYHSKTHYDHQASCPDRDEQSSFAGLRSIRIPTLSMFYEFLSFNFWSSQITWAYVNFNIYNWLWSPSTSSVYGQEGVATYTVTDSEEEPEDESDCTPIDEDTPTNHSCTKYEAHYYFIPGKTEGSGTYYCENCTRSFILQRITGTNLLLVVADLECEGECQFVDIVQAPREDENPDDCVLEMRYRKRPDGCYSKDDAEDDTQCGSVSIVPSTLYIICLAIITLFYSMRESVAILT